MMAAPPRVSASLGDRKRPATAAPEISIMHGPMYWKYPLALEKPNAVITAARTKTTGRTNSCHLPGPLPSGSERSRIAITMLSREIRTLVMNTVMKLMSSPAAPETKSVEGFIVRGKPSKDED